MAFTERLKATVYRDTALNTTALWARLAGGGTAVPQPCDFELSGLPPHMLFISVQRDNLESNGSGS